MMHQIGFMNRSSFPIKPRCHITQYKWMYVRLIRPIAVTLQSYHRYMIRKPLFPAYFVLKYPPTCALAFRKPCGNIARHRWGPTLGQHSGSIVRMLWQCQSPTLGQHSGSIVRMLWQCHSPTFGTNVGTIFRQH